MIVDTIVELPVINVVEALPNLWKCKGGRYD